MLDPIELERLVQRSEDAYKCAEILYGGEPTEEELIEARFQNFLKS